LGYRHADGEEFTGFAKWFSQNGARNATSFRFSLKSLQVRLELSRFLLRRKNGLDCGKRFGQGIGAIREISIQDGKEPQLDLNGIVAISRHDVDGKSLVDRLPGDNQTRLSRLDFVRSWNNHSSPLPVRAIRGLLRGRALPRVSERPTWIQTGPKDRPFDFCAATRRLCADIVRSCPDLSHIDVNRLLFSVTQARSTRSHGLQARVTPLRFQEGMLVRRRGNRAYQVQRYFVADREMLYVVSFCLPRFLDQDFDDKFITLFHELYHINPLFNGDLRRHEGRCSIHSRSQRGYDAQMAHLARLYLAGGADPALHAFLRLNFAQLEHRHGRVVGVVVPRPKLIPVPASRAASG
jgi:hypothetical protein